MKRSLLFIILFILLAGNIIAFTTEKELFTLAESRYYAKNYSIALETYDEFIKTYPLSNLIPDVQYRRAVCFYRLGQYEESLTLLKRIENQYRSTRYLDYIPFWAGLIFYNLKDYGRAIGSFESYLQDAENNETSAQALFYKGLCEIFLENYVEGEGTLLKFLSEYKDQVLRPSAVVLLAFTYIKTGNYEAMLSLPGDYDPGEFPDAEKTKLSFYKAEALWGLGQKDEAIVLYNQLLDVSAEIASVAFRRLFIFAQQDKNFGEMEKLLQAAEEVFAGSHEVLADFWLSLGIENYKRKNLELAEHFLLKLWNLRDKKVMKETVPLYLAEIYIQKNDYQKAQDLLKRYILEKEESSGENNSGGDTSIGILSEGNISAEVIFRLGDISLMLKDYTQAITYYRQFISENPENIRRIDAEYYLSYSLYKLDKVAEALEITKKVLEMYTAGDYHREFLKLNALLFKGLGRVNDASSVLKQYIALYPDDTRTRIDLLKIYFVRNEYDAVIGEVQDLDRSISSLKEKDIYSYILSRYLLGLSYIVKKTYTDAVFNLSLVQENEARKAGLSLIVPYSLFYHAWSLYRLGNFNEASGLFSQVIRNYPGHELKIKSLYFAGWCHYSDGNFEKAIVYFSTLAEVNPEQSLKAKALFFNAKSLLNLDKLDEAKSIFKIIFNKMQKTSFADDALFEYASILAQQGETEDAASAFFSLTEVYPKSVLRENAFYQRGEIYFNQKLYERARYAFYDYRLKYPEGALIDAALYWGGLCAYYLSEKLGAVLLWEKIIEEHPESAYRPNALKKTADIYAENGEYSRALSLYSELIASYEREASAVNAETSAKELRYLILGLSDQEAEYTVIIERNKGAQSRAGREAMLSLAKLYLYEEGGEKQDVAYNLLLQVVVKSEDPDTASRAQFLIGEYFFLKEDFIKAGNEFLKAALIDPKNRDLMAFSIYKAAEMMKRAGKPREVRELVARIEKNFPQSHWAEEGKRLLEGME